MSAPLPHSKKAERVVLGCALQRPDLLFEAESIDASWFWIQAHRVIFQELRSLVFSDDEIPPQALRAFVVSNAKARLGEHAKFEGLPLVDFVSSLIDDAISPDVQFAPALEELVEYYKRRRLCELGRELYRRAASGESSQNVAAVAHDETTEIAGVRIGSSTGVDQDIEDWFDTTTKSIEGEKSIGRQASTNVWAVDKLLDGGGTFGHYTIFAAKKKMGKTRLTTRIAYEIARSGYPVDHYSVEMTPFEMLSLYSTCITGLGYRELAGYHEDDSERYRKAQAAVKARAELKELPVRLFSGRRNIRDIEINTYARAAREDRPLVVVVDYLQIVGSEGSTEYERVTNVTKSLAQLAPSTNAWVIATSQFNRESGAGMPRPEQLRSSGQIEQDVDELLIFHRPGEELEDATAEQKRRSILWCALNRHGATRRVELDSDMVKMNFGRIDDYPI